MLQSTQQNLLCESSNHMIESFPAKEETKISTMTWEDFRGLY